MSESTQPAAGNQRTLTGRVLRKEITRGFARSSIGMITDSTPCS